MRRKRNKVAHHHFGSEFSNSSAQPSLLYKCACSVSIVMSIVCAVFSEDLDLASLANCLLYVTACQSMSD